MQVTAEQHVAPAMDRLARLAGVEIGEVVPWVVHEREAEVGALGALEHAVQLRATDEQTPLVLVAERRP